jgi:hypothetical protein
VGRGDKKEVPSPTKSEWNKKFPLPLWERARVRGFYTLLFTAKTI